MKRPLPFPSIAFSGGSLMHGSRRGVFVPVRPLKVFTFGSFKAFQVPVARKGNIDRLRLRSRVINMAREQSR